MLNKQKVRQMSKEIQSVLDKHLSLDGIKVKLGAGSFNDVFVTFKLECATINADGTVNSKLVDDFKFYCSRYGLKPDDIGKEFATNGDTYIIEGCKPKSSKYPIIGKRSDGKSFKFSPEQVKLNLNRKVS